MVVYDLPRYARLQTELGFCAGVHSSEETGHRCRQLSPKLPETVAPAANNPGGGFPTKKFPSKNNFLIDLICPYSNGMLPRNELYRIDKNDSKGYAARFAGA